MGIKVDDICFLYERGTAMQVNALDHITVDIPEDQFIGLIGHTGSGKSTFVQTLNGLLKVTSGHIYYNGADIYDEDYKNEWMQISYTGKEIADNMPFYETKRKERVRSKSELSIANMLDRYGVPYKYECPVTMQNGKTVYPDFTVLKVRERKVFYWEHRGMMDDREYARQAVFKAKQFRKIGIIPGDNMIITEETSLEPLGTDEIENVIKKFLL